MHRERTAAALVLSSFAAAGAVEPLSFAEALALALRENPRIHDACDAVDGARYGVDVAGADFALQFTPQATSGLGTDTETSQSSVVSLNKKFSYGTIIELAAGTTSSENDFYRSFSGVTLSQGLFQSFGKSANLAPVADALRRVSSARRQASLTEEQVVLDVADAFYRIVGLESLVKILEGSLERSRHHVRAAEARLSRALATKMDIFRAEGQAAAAEGALLDAEESLSESRDSLRLLLGMRADDPLSVETDLVDVTVEEEEGALVETALEKRVELAEAEDEVADAERRRALADRGFYPDLRVGLNFSLVGFGQSFEQSTSLDDSGVRFLVGGTNPLDRSAEAARVGQALIDVQRRKRELAELRERVALDVRQAVRHLATVSRRIAVQERNVQATRSKLELANLRFERGYAETLEVLEAEDALSQAERDDVTLRMERVLASLRLRRAAGLLPAFVESLVGRRPERPACS